MKSSGIREAKKNIHPSTPVRPSMGDLLHKSSIVCNGGWKYDGLVATIHDMIVCVSFHGQGFFCVIVVLILKLWICVVFCISFQQQSLFSVQGVSPTPLLLSSYSQNCLFAPGAFPNLHRNEACIYKNNTIEIETSNSIPPNQVPKAIKNVAGVDGRHKMFTKQHKRKPTVRGFTIQKNAQPLAYPRDWRGFFSWNVTDIPLCWDEDTLRLSECSCSRIRKAQVYRINSSIQNRTIMPSHDIFEIILEFPHINLEKSTVNPAWVEVW